MPQFEQTYFPKAFKERLQREEEEEASREGPEAFGKLLAKRQIRKIKRELRREPSDGDE